MHSLPRFVNISMPLLKNDLSEPAKYASVSTFIPSVEVSPFSASMCFEVHEQIIATGALSDK